jgi:rhomboid family GlyGly-CTERM serine protease
MNTISKIYPECRGNIADTTDAAFQHYSKLPFITALLVLSGLALALSPKLVSMLQFNRTAVMQGELWRIFTGHRTHWSGSHLLWDMLVFSMLEAIIEWLSRGRLLLFLAAGCLVISLMVFAFLPEMSLYRGLSGLDSGLFMLLLVLLYRNNTAGSSMLQKMPYFLAALLFAGKTLFEVTTGHTLFVQSSDLFIPVPLAHLGGAAAGMAIGLMHSK